MCMLCITVLATCDLDVCSFSSIILSALTWELEKSRFTEDIPE